MIDRSGALKGLHLLVVEDDFLIAVNLAYELEEGGVEVVGPASSVSEALALVEAEPLDGAVLDVNLGADRVYPVADALLRRKVPFAFTTGYDSRSIPELYCDVPRLEKPVDAATLAKVLARHIAGVH